MNSKIINQAKYALGQASQCRLFYAESMDIDNYATDAVNFALECLNKAPDWAPKAKPLQWEERSTTCFVADTPIGAYWVDKVDKVWVGYLESYERITPMAPSFTSEPEAKEACQAHYNALVLSLLEPETLNAKAAR